MATDGDAVAGTLTRHSDSSIEVTPSGMWPVWDSGDMTAGDHNPSGRPFLLYLLPVQPPQYFTYGRGTQQGFAQGMQRYADLCSAFGMRPVTTPGNGRSGPGTCSQNCLPLSSYGTGHPSNGNPGRYVAGHCGARPCEDWCAAQAPSCSGWDTHNCDARDSGCPGWSNVVYSSGPNIIGCATGAAGESNTASACNQAFIHMPLQPLCGVEKS